MQHLRQNNQVPSLILLLLTNIISFLCIKTTSSFVINTNSNTKPSWHSTKKNSRGIYDAPPLVSKNTQKRFTLYSSSPNSKEEKKQESETELHAHLNALNETFNYENRIQTSASSSNETNSDLFRCGYVSILGLPNMGKSTLTNQLLDADLSAIAPLPQTTRHSILGILTSDQSQVLFLDTPGVILDPKYKLQNVMLDSVFSSLRDADVVIWVIDVNSVDFWHDQVREDDERTILQPTSATNTNSTASILSNRLKWKKLLVVLNKVDLEEDTALSSSAYETEIAVLIRKLRSIFPDAMAIVPASAKAAGDAGVKVIRKILLNDQEDIDASIRELGRPYTGMFPPSEDNAHSSLKDSMTHFLPYIPAPLYGTDPDVFTDRNERFLASEMIRQSIFTSALTKEIPYCCEVRIESFKDEPSILKIVARICVERDSQKGIVIGKQGKQIKNVGVEARRTLEDFFGKKVFLDLSVKVDANWRKKEDKLKEFGYINN